MTPAVSLEGALAAVHEGYPQDPDADHPRIVIHTFLGSLGADWDRDAALEAIRLNASSLRATHPDSFMWKMGHRLYIDQYTDRGSALFIETRPDAFEAVAP